MGIVALLQLDLHVDASWQIQLHQGVHRLVGWVHDIHQALVRTAGVAGASNATLGDAATASSSLN